MKHLLVPTVLLLSACHPPEPTEAAWLRSFSADWANLNHRLAYLALHPTPDGVDAAFIGGASTTGVIFDEACLDPKTCAEFPVTDVGLLDAEVVRASSEDVVFATGTVTLDSDDGGGTLHVELPRAAEGAVHAWIGGFTVDTTAPLPTDAASCYDPRYGWMPTRLRMAVGDAVLAGDGRSVDVPVDGAFTAGLSYEDARACLDLVAADAHATLTLDVVVAVGDLDVATRTVGDDAAWPGKDDAQSIADVGDTTVDFAGPTSAVGWSVLEFRFHEVVEPGRGAYLRTLQVEADPASDVAFGWASSTSLTQLSGFDYAFEGTALDLGDLGDLGATVDHHADDALPADLDADGVPVVHALPPAD